MSPDRQLLVDVDLTLSPWSNARQYYDQKKTAANKEQKTIQSSAKALRSTERKVASDLKKSLKQEKDLMRPMRRQLWFEKFFYFISSEGYLVLGGRDAQQSDILYRKYLKRGDVWLSADLDGATSVVIKNKAAMTDYPIPPSTLSQAGTLAVSTSTAWDSKAAMSAFWVRADKVSKMTQTGEYLTTGIFAINDQKNFLPPSQLLLGVCVMFQVSETSKARHLRHRHPDHGVNGPNPPPDRANLEATVGQEDIRSYTKDLDIVCENVQEFQHIENEQEDLSDNGLDESREQSEVEDQHCTYIDVEGGAPNITGDNSVNQSNNRAGRKIFRKLEQLHNLPDKKRSPLMRCNPLQPDESSHNSSSHASDLSAAEDISINEDAESGEMRGKGDFTLHQADDCNGTSKVDLESQHGVRHLSARERRLLRSKKDPDSEDLLDQAESSPIIHADAAEPLATSASKVNSTGTIQKSATKQQAHPMRGKHGKRSKIKTKYADQDEEDRALALQLLGSATGQQKTANDAEAKAAKERELAAQRDRRRKQHALAAEKGMEAEELRRLQMHESTEPPDSEERRSYCDLDAFVGTLMPEDEILDVLIMCAPWYVLSNHYLSSTLLLTLRPTTGMPLAAGARGKRSYSLVRQRKGKLSKKY